MCNFCDGKKVSVIDYDNYGSMGTAYGQRHGVAVRAGITMQGNMLTLDCNGSYRSRSDCYYESWGIDCDNKHAVSDKPSIKQIKYCPFCGKDLSSNKEYQREYAKINLPILRNKLSLYRKCKKIIDSYGFTVTVWEKWYVDRDKIPERGKPDRTEVNRIEKKFDINVFDNIKKLSKYVSYGYSDNEYINYDESIAKYVGNFGYVRLGECYRFDGVSTTVTVDKILDFIKENNVKKVSKDKVNEWIKKIDNTRESIDKEIKAIEAQINHIQDECD